MGSSGQWEKKGRRGPPVSLCVGLFDGEEKRFGMWEREVGSSRQRVREREKRSTLSVTEWVSF